VTPAADGTATTSAGAITATVATTSTAATTATAAITATGQPTAAQAGVGVGLVITDAGGVQGIEPGTYIRGYSLLDRDFRSSDGEVAGSVEDFFVELNTGRIVFVIIQWGGFLGIGDKEFALPLSAFSWSAENELVLNFTEEQLQNFPDLDEDWPDLMSTTWDDQVNAFWLDLGIDPGPNIDESSGLIIRQSEVNGLAIVDLGIGTGTIQDVLVDLAGGRVGYVLADFGVATADNNEPFILPLEIFEFEGTEPAASDIFIFDANVTVEILQTAPRFDPSIYGNLELLPPGWNEPIDAYWQQVLS